MGPTIESLDREAENDENAMSSGPWWARRSIILDADDAAAREFAASPEGQRRGREREANALRALRVDSGLSDRQSDRLAVLETIAEGERQAEIENENDEWTIETTIARRAAWNEAIRSAAVNGTVASMALGRIERQCGLRVATLKRHVARHGL